MPQRASKNIATFIANLYSKKQFKNLFSVNLLINSWPTSSKSAENIHINKITKFSSGIPIISEISTKSIKVII